MYLLCIHTNSKDFYLVAKYLPPPPHQSRENPWPNQEYNLEWLNSEIEWDKRKWMPKQSDVLCDNSCELLNTSCEFHTSNRWWLNVSCWLRPVRTGPLPGAGCKQQPKSWPVWVAEERATLPIISSKISQSFLHVLHTFVQVVCRNCSAICGRKCSGTEINSSEMLFAEKRLTNSHKIQNSSWRSHG